MKSKWIVRVPCCLAATLFLTTMASPLLVAQTPNVGSKPDSVQISKLLSDANTQARSAEYDADTLVSYTRSTLAWETHADQLNAMKTDVNELGKTIARLQQLRPQGSPWQQAAIDRIDPLLRDMADELTTTIDYLNKHQLQINMPPYQNYAHANYELAGRTAALISDIDEYGKAKGNSAAILQRKLELPPKSEGNQ